MAGMDHQSGRFVDHQDVIVLIDDVERDIFGDDFKFISRTVHDHLNNIAGFYAVVALDGFSVDDDAPCFGSLLHPVAR